MINIKLMSKLYLVVAHNLNEARKARDGNKKQKTLKMPEQLKIGDNVLVRDHTSKAFQPKYKDFCITGLLGKNQVEIKDNHSHTTKVHCRDIKKIPMSEKVCQLYEEEQIGKVRQGRKAIPDNKMPDLGRDSTEELNTQDTKHNHKGHRRNNKDSAGTPRNNYSHSDTDHNISRNIETPTSRNTPNWEKYSTSSINSNWNSEPQWIPQKNHQNIQKNSSSDHQTPGRQPIKIKHKQLLENLLTISDRLYQLYHIPTPRIATNRKLVVTSIPTKPYTKDRTRYGNTRTLKL